MSDTTRMEHSHVFLGDAHEESERKTWTVICLCGAMMVAEIVGGLLFGSIALVADGLHMSTHAGALLLAALAYTYARRNADNPRFTFGTGKLGDLAGFTSAIILAMIAILIGYEAMSRLFAPVAIRFGEAIPIASLGLVVNAASAWLLSTGSDHHHQGHSHGHGDAHSHHDHPHDDTYLIETAAGAPMLEIHEDGVPPRDLSQAVMFEEHADHHSGGAAHRDNNMRAAVIHVIADAAVSVLVIIGLVLARVFGWMWMDPLVGLIGALVIASWSYGLIRDTGAILLDVNPEPGLTERLRQEIELDGDRVRDLHVWRLGPGHLGAIVSVFTRQAREAEFYREKLARFPSLSHLTVEVSRQG